MTFPVLQPYCDGKRVLLHLEFLHVVGRGNVDDTAPAADGIPGAVQQECRRSKEAAAKVEEGNVLVGRALFAAALKDLLLRNIVDRRVQLHES